jgi:hypothetical protein
LAAEAEKIDTLEKRIVELTDNLNRRECYMQTKEKKWVEVENYLMTRYDGNDELFYQMRDLKLCVEGDNFITNVVTENE